MSKTSTYQTPFRRKGEGKTNYAKRLAFVKSGLPRVVVRKSTNHMVVQVVQSEGGKDTVLVSAHSSELGKFSYTGHTGNMPAAYLTGFLAGTRAAKKVSGDIIVDIGLQRITHKTRLFAVIKGIKDAGLAVRVDEEALPSNDRVMGKHIEGFANKDPSKMNAAQFSLYAGKIDPKQFTQVVEAAKKAITEGVSSA